MTLWSTIFSEAIDPDTPVLVHRIDVLVYSCMLIDLGVTFEHRPLPLLAAWHVSKSKTKDYRPTALIVVAYALANWDRLSADHKIWMFERFRVNLDKAREAAIFYVQTQERVITQLAATGRKA